MSIDAITTEPTPYFPFESGRHEARAGLFRLGIHEVHGRRESHVFTFDSDHARFLHNKAHVHEQLHRHYVVAAPPPSLLAAAVRFLAARLAQEVPYACSWEASSGLFVNRWVGWSARIDPEANRVLELIRFDAPYADHVRGVEPIDALDLIVSTLSEDIALVTRHPATGEEWSVLLHVCAPHFWDPRDKVGRSFAAIHAPVADAGPLNAQGPRMMRAVIEQGPFLRFAWGPSANNQLNHHPEADHGRDRSGDPVVDGAGWFIRVERQVLWGLPEVNAALFTIRPSWYPMTSIAADPLRRRQLADALADMSPSALAYKSFAHARDPLVAWLRGPG